MVFLLFTQLQICNRETALPDSHSFCCRSSVLSLTLCLSTGDEFSRVTATGSRFTVARCFSLESRRSSLVASLSLSSPFVDRRRVRSLCILDCSGTPPGCLLDCYGTGRFKIGTREVYEEKLRTGNLHHDPTLKPGLGTPRCPRCLSPIDSNSEDGEWAITPVLHDAAAAAGSGLGALLSLIYGFNSGISHVKNYVKGPKWRQFLVGAPSLMLFTAGSAAFGGYALPRFTQLTVTSYYAASSASHYGISLLTRHVEEAHTSKPQQEKP